MVETFFVPTQTVACLGKPVTKAIDAVIPTKLRPPSTHSEQRRTLYLLLESVMGQAPEARSSIQR